MIEHRPYNNDYNLIMNFLREMYLQTKTQCCWLPQRWEYAEHFVNHVNIEHSGDDWHKYIRIWEDNGTVVGVCHKEESNNAFLQVRPGYESLTDEMLDHAESTIARYNSEGVKTLTVWSPESNIFLSDHLIARGYTRGDVGSYYNAQYVNKEYIPHLPDGYSFTSAVEIKDTLSRQNAVHRAFHPDDESLREVPASFLSMEKAPLFRPELEIMTQYKDGTLTSFCVVWYDERTGIGMFEPVGTHPNHRRLGLGREMLLEGLRRLKAIGANRAFVESYGDNRKAFYNSVGFETFDKDCHWTKELRAQCPTGRY
ncbi:MAG: GNAT family N-acetyltransferase [Armatimonadota bacterium]